MKCLVVLLLTPVLLFAQPDVTMKLKQFMLQQVSTNGFNGNILVGKSGKIICQDAFGFRNYDTKEFLNNNSVFELASVSKQFTAMGILLLKEKGKLQLTDPLRKFFPELPYMGVTIKHLLTHTSGLPDYMEQMAVKWDHKKVAFNADVIKFLAQQKIPAKFKPGTQWEYSNTGYQMLSSIIEKVSGLNYADFMKQNIFKPLGMKSTRVYNTRRSSKEIIPNYAYGYVYSKRYKKFMIPDLLPSYDYVIYLDGITGDGTVNSTTGDLLMWDRALKNHTLISERLQNEMFAAQATVDAGSGMSYGYGVMVGKNNIDNYIFHDGGWAGYSTLIYRYVSKDITLIVLSNNGSDCWKVAEGLAFLVMGIKLKK